MNITFFIGNGFDIGLGLKTRYTDFYNDYCNIKDNDNDNIKDFKSKLLEYQNNKETRIIDWADFELAFGKHSKDFDIRQKADYIERFENFITAFNNYLENEELKLDYSNTQLIVQVMRKAMTSFYDIRLADKELFNQTFSSVNSFYYHFISFNYTKSVDNCVRLLDQTYKHNSRTQFVREVLHIHGFIDENMIIGVNDPSQIENIKFANDKEILQEIVKPIQNEDSRSNYEKQVIDIINNSDCICIYGMSIGKTDKKWWKTISEWLAQNKKRILIILKFNNEYSKRITPRRNKELNKIIDDFLDLTEQPEEIKDVIRSRILVEYNHCIFQMNLTKKDDDNPKEYSA